MSEITEFWNYPQVPLLLLKSVVADFPKGFLSKFKITYKTLRPLSLIVQISPMYFLFLSSTGLSQTVLQMIVLLYWCIYLRFSLNALWEACKGNNGLLLFVCFFPLGKHQFFSRVFLIKAWFCFCRFPFWYTELASLIILGLLWKLLAAVTADSSRAWWSLKTVP